MGEGKAPRRTHLRPVECQRLLWTESEQVMLEELLRLPQQRSRLLLPLPTYPPIQRVLLKVQAHREQKQ